jgi:hypothetical protein
VWAGSRLSPQVIAHALSREYIEEAAFKVPTKGLATVQDHDSDSDDASPRGALYSVDGRRQPARLRLYELVLYW